MTSNLPDPQTHLASFAAAVAVAAVVGDSYYGSVAVEVVMAVKVVEPRASTLEVAVASEVDSEVGSGFGQVLIPYLQRRYH